MKLNFPVIPSTAEAPAPVYSRLAADPVLGELVDLFIQEMPDRISALETLARLQDWNQLARIAHQLKGAAGSYGFDHITLYAARLEAAARDGQEDAILSALTELTSANGLSLGCQVTN
jgi:HPt (histidine-containing phosphotransfer) domain-containing protein